MRDKKISKVKQKNKENDEDQKVNEDDDKERSNKEDEKQMIKSSKQQHQYNSFIFNFERIVEDVVFLIFLAGNDFLPHIQTMSVSEGIIERIFVVYKRIISKTGIYFTQGDVIIPAQISLKNYERWSGK
ncbi:MAG: hypothetical protein EZS28_046590 [Streblomastix strix]|uniref:Xrn1 helical domain-containing protein n=1 Tax=Streblomastix strix TaxID=222440 RepID=A0A5J4TJE3_9EUKA|nr:MAG: hypothetical protein EZS28_046590 [Streblomastix strix]